MEFDREKIARISKEITDWEQSMFVPRATPNSAAVRLHHEEDDPLRGPFARDRDRIIYSGAYRRYVGKTQVVYFASQFDEQISNRSNHTAQVSQVARTIGRMLRLNLDLIEAIALGHDLGHPPFGHDGEVFLSDLCKKKGIGEFHHNVHSLYTVDHISNHGEGMNLTLQVRDGIVSHDGETHNVLLKPEYSKTEKDIRDYCQRKTAGEKVSSVPMTLEGCVVRFSDVIAYIGQDIEDAIHMGLLERDAIPVKCARGLGKTNREIIGNLVTDVILSSYEKDYIAFGEEVSDLVVELKEFNWKIIYQHPVINRERTKIKEGFHVLFDKFLQDVVDGDENSYIYRHFLAGRNFEYLKEKSPEEKVRDFMATMTDRYFTFALQRIVIPEVGLRFGG
ncbi:MAG: HD domain-containing protein [Chloroflexi bacterium]|nr:HD domain-containing protein [Chloroflexota bacterium]